MVGFIWILPIFPVMFISPSRIQSRILCCIYFYFAEICISSGYPFFNICIGNLLCSVDYYVPSFPVFFFKLFIWRAEWQRSEVERERKERERSVFLLLVHSPNNCNSQGWASLKLGTRTPSWSLSLPRLFSWTLNQNQRTWHTNWLSNIGCWCYKGLLNPWYPHVDFAVYFINGVFWEIKVLNFTIVQFIHFSFYREDALCHV